MVSFVCFRSVNQVASLEQMFRRDGVMSHYKAMSLNCILVDSCVNWLQRLEESSCGDDGKWLLGKCLLWTRSFLATEVSSRCIYVLSAVLLFCFCFCFFTNSCLLFFLRADEDRNRFKPKNHLYIIRSNKIRVLWLT